MKIVAWILLPVISLGNGPKVDVYSVYYWHILFGICQDEENKPIINKIYVHFGTIIQRDYWKQNPGHIFHMPL